MRRRSAILAMALLVVASPAMAHLGQGVSGFFHPFTGLDHLLAMIGVGMWTWQLAAHRPAAAFLVPLAFVVMMGVGTAAFFAGMELPLGEAGILASVFLLGGFVATAVRMPAAAAMVVVGLFAVFHGYAHALEAPVMGGGSFVLAFLAATALLHAIGVGLGWAAQRLGGDIGLRTFGGFLVAGGGLLLTVQ